MASFRAHDYQPRTAWIWREWDSDFARATLVDGNRWKSDEVDRRFHNAYTICGLLYSISVVGCFVLHQYVPFNPLMLVWQPSQTLSLFVLYLILSFPFFFGAACIGLALLRFAGNVNRLYFFDLFGSGIGALGIIVTMYLIPPAQNLTLISTVGFCAVLIANWESWKTPQWRRIVPITGLAAVFIGYLLFNPISIKISPYKGLSSTLNFPDAQILNERHSPFGVLHVVRSELIRAVPGVESKHAVSGPTTVGRIHRCRWNDSDNRFRR